VTVRAAARSRLLRMCLTKTEHDGNRGTLEGAPACRSQLLYRSPPLPVLLPEKNPALTHRTFRRHYLLWANLKVRPLTGLSPGQQIGRKNL
jgi:hypothetical protein